MDSRTLASSLAVVAAILSLTVGSHAEDLEDGRIGILSEERPHHMLLDHHEHLLRTRRQTGRQFVRITHFLDASVTSLASAKKTHVQRLIQDAEAYFETTFRVDRLTSNILIPRNCQNNRFWSDLTNLTVRTCVDACATTTVCGQMTVPDNHLATCRSCPLVGTSRRGTCIDANNGGTGVAAADLVIYVSAKNTPSCSGTNVDQLAAATACMQEGGLDRPVVGNINLCPNALQESNPALYNGQLATVKHELFHVLAFSPTLYAYFRDASGNPRTARKTNSYEPSLGFLTTTQIPGLSYQPNSVYQWSNNTVAVERRQWKASSGNSARTFYMMVTPKVREVARNHFNCPSLSGAELENQNGVATALTHWEKRIFENEAMCGVSTQHPVVSNITLALMEDTGWYDVDYSKAELLRWGRNLGCDFARGSCLSWMEKKIASGSPVDPFCRNLPNTQPRLFCNLDRTSKAICNLNEAQTALPAIYQYITSTVVPGISANRDRYGGSVSTADYCPFRMQFTTTGTSKTSDCSFAQNAPSNTNVGLEFYGTGSKCVQQGEKWTYGRTFTLTYGSGCYKFYCATPNRLTIDVGLARVDCTNRAGQTACITQTIAGQASSGSIICPSYSDMCEANGVFTAPPARTSIPCPAGITCNAATATPNERIRFISVGNCSYQPSPLTATTTMPITSAPATAAPTSAPTQAALTPTNTPCQGAACASASDAATGGTSATVAGSTSSSSDAITAGNAGNLVTTASGSALHITWSKFVLVPLAAFLSLISVFC